MLNICSVVHRAGLSQVCSFGNSSSAIYLIIFLSMVLLVWEIRTSFCNVGTDESCLSSTVEWSIILYTVLSKCFARCAGAQPALPSLFLLPVF